MPPVNTHIPTHIAIVMDGNGRWAKSRHLPRVAGHKRGVETVREIVRHCAERGVEVLTLFAFSSENWRRPEAEVSALMELFINALRSRVQELHENAIRLRFIGARETFSAKLQQAIQDAETLTASNTGMQLVIAANYGGRWDIAQAAQALARQVAAGEMAPEQINPEAMAGRVCAHDLPEPDLFIRTGGEQRISNFLLWQLAYTELYFTPLLWPDFNADALDQAMADFASRQRRFGQTGEQVERQDA